MMNIGWIKLYRQLMNHPLWQDKPFAKGQAWVDLLLMADSKDGECLWQGKVQTTRVGEVRTSILYLSQRWGWGNRKTKTFLENLKKVGMIDFVCTSKCTSIFIANYAKYSAKPNGDAHQMHNECISSAYQVHTHKNIKEDKEDKEDNISLPYSIIPPNTQDDSGCAYDSHEPPTEVPSWMELDDGWNELPPEELRECIYLRKEHKFQELKSYAQGYCLVPDTSDELARECMAEHNADPAWITQAITGGMK